MFRDPLVRKELGGASRRWTTYLVRVLYVGIVGFALYRTWSGAKPRLEEFGASEFAELGRDLFREAPWIQLGLVTLAALAAGSDMILRETRAGTLGLLFLTPLTPFRVVLGKWKACLALSSTIFLAGLPVVGICLYLGGVGLWDLAWSTALTVGCAGLAAAVGIYTSARSGSATSAFIRAFLLVLFLPAAVCLGLTLILTSVNREAAVLVLIGTHPVYAALAAQHFPFFGGGYMEWGWVSSSALCLLCSWLFLRRAAVQAHRRASGAGRWKPPAQDFRTLPSYFGRARAGRAALVIHGGVWEQNALLWKDLATRASLRMGRWTRVVLFAILLLLTALSWFASAIGAMDRPRLNNFHFVAAIVLLLFVVQGAGLFAPEREGRRWDLLLSTPATTGGIVFSKLVSGILSPEGLASLGILGLALIGWGGPRGILPFLTLSAVTLLFVAFAYLLSAFASLHARTIRGAFLSTLGALLAFLVGVPLLTSPGLEELSLSTSSLLGQSLSPLHVADGVDGFDRKEPHYWSNVMVQAGPLRLQFALYAAFYGLSSLLLLQELLRRFRRAALS